MGVRWRRCLWCFVFFLLGRHVSCGAVLVCSALLLLHNCNFENKNKSRNTFECYPCTSSQLKKYCEALVSARICAKFGVSASGSGGQNIRIFHCWREAQGRHRRRAGQGPKAPLRVEKTAAGSGMSWRTTVAAPQMGTRHGP